jgi:flagellum-specific peptidoglycan hydrolase FlgJ
MRELQAAGYATDPAYAEKVIRIWENQLGGLTVARR